MANADIISLIFNLPIFYSLEDYQSNKNIFEESISIFESNKNNFKDYIRAIFKFSGKEKEMIVKIADIKKVYSLIRIFFEEKFINFLINQKTEYNTNEILEKINKNPTLRAGLKIHLKLVEFPIKNYILLEDKRKLPEDNLIDKSFQLFEKSLILTKIQIKSFNNNVFNNNAFNNNMFNNNSFNPNFNQIDFNNNFQNIDNFNQKKLEDLQKLLNEERNKNTELNNTIKELKEKLSRYPFELFPGEKMMTVNFCSMNQDITFSVICKNTDIFINLELQLYKDYPKYSETENYFTVRGVKINKYKSLEFNNIKNNDIILLIPLNSTFLQQ